MAFWNRSSENLVQLLHGISLDAIVLLADRVSEIFAEDIVDAIRKLRLKEYNERNMLLKEVINELASLLNDQRDKWRVWKESDVKKLLPELVTATQWKLQIKGYAYSNETTDRLANEGIKVLPALGEILLTIKQDRQKSRRRVQAEKSLRQPSDYAEVTQRALRCVITKLRHPAHFQQTIFAWNQEFKLTIKTPVMHNYLRDQLSLYAYMVNADENAFPFEELTKLLRKFVANQIAGNEKGQVAADIISNTFFIFLENRKSYLQKTFFVDKLLYAYFIDIIRNRKEIRSYRNREGKIDRNDFPDNYFERENDNSLSKYLEILKHCLNLQDKTCQKIIRTRFLSDYADKISYEAVADLLNLEPRTVENRGPACNGLLKKCVIDFSKQQGLRPL